MCVDDPAVHVHRRPRYSAWACAGSAEGASACPRPPDLASNSKKQVRNCNPAKESHCCCKEHVVGAGGRPEDSVHMGGLLGGVTADSESLAQLSVMSFREEPPKPDSDTGRPGRPITGVPVTVVLITESD